NSTGQDLDKFVPMVAGEYQLVWQTVSESLLPNTTVQLVLEGRSNASAENFWFDNIVFDGVMGINDQAASQFSIYPNPASKGFVNISSKASGSKIISIFDVLGKQVLKANLNGDRLDISSLNSGVYILQIEQGNASITKKLIVE